MQTRYTIVGTVTRGERYGTTLGYPTANLSVTALDDVERGVYAGTAVREKSGATYRAGIVIGAQGTNPPKVEAHLLDFSGDLYGETLTLHLVERLREIRSYANAEDLKRDIADDLKKIATRNL